MTCRPFGAEEARAAGFLNRVVPAAELDSSVEELAVSLAEKPRLALLATKRHVDAVTEGMVGTARSWADADGLLAGLAAHQRCWEDDRRVLVDADLDHRLQVPQLQR